MDRQAGISKASFDALLEYENVNFMEVLAGGDTTSGVPKVAQDVVGHQPNAIKMLKTALYDTFILGYLCGYTADTTKYSVVRLWCL